MISVSNILTELARVIGVSRPGPKDSEIVIDPRYSFVNVPISPIDSLNLGGAGVTNRQSFAFSAAATVTAGGGAFGANIGLIGKGLWRFNVHGNFSSNHGPSANFAESALVITDGTGTLYLLHFECCGAAAAPTVQNMTRIIDVCLPRDSILSHTLGNNAAGQTDTHTYSGTAQKLL